jgi:hypothetical protein
LPLSTSQGLATAATGLKGTSVLIVAIEA